MPINLSPTSGYGRPMCGEALPHRSSGHTLRGCASRGGAAARP